MVCNFSYYSLLVFCMSVLLVVWPLFFSFDFIYFSPFILLSLAKVLSTFSLKKHILVLLICFSIPSYFYLYCNICYFHFWLNLDLICSLFSRLLKCEVRFFIGDSFFMQALSGINFPLRTSFAVSNNNWCFVFLFLFI